MAEKTVFKMFLAIFFYVFISNASFSLAGGVIEAPQDKCNCYNVCSKNYTTNAVYDVPKIAACQRGCRYYVLDLHASHEPNRAKAFKNAKESCIKSCTEGYKDLGFRSACKLGCSTFDIPLEFCSIVEEITPQMSYSLLIEESDILIHSGEPEPDDSLTDPALRKQIQKTLVAMLDATPKIPEIRFKNMPVKTEKVTELSQTSFRCPKFYGLDSNFEFRNGKIIIGDLYLFAGVLIFVVLCFLLSHHLETRNIKRQLLESRFTREDFGDKEPLLKVDFHPGEGHHPRRPPGFRFPDINDSIFYSDPFQPKFSKIAFIFPEKELAKEKKNPVETPKA